MLTEADRRILRLIQREGRITNQELSSRCGLSASACFDRLKRLRDQGYIRGFSADLDPAKLDRSLLIFIEVLMDRTTGEIFQDFAEAVKVMPEILECHMVGGGFDFLLKVRVRDMAAYRAFLVETLVRIPGVRETRTYAVLDEVKNSTHLPI
ncbi:Lrp/AsnC ligand binding domain-containing protein [Sphingopyxis yananensis]|uniref:Lrp/AsnC ligand binding domain-containing protein n=1 Tax=Sphingopyxis yananensis TaxID=2886687 RepID=UPI001D10B34B|nr:Lrp/AsnC ligand binding domain-containing protein [Sphingopyxis yananensis]MCC2602781.1 Lrp/AsnC ligand binding domain-containing protein [Sphingopyxis yananensis]